MTKIILTSFTIAELMGVLMYSIYRRKYFSEKILEQLFILAIIISTIFYLLIYEQFDYINTILSISLTLNVFSLNFLIFVLLLINIDRSRSTYVIAWVKYGYINVKNGKLAYSNRIKNIENNLAMLDQRIYEHKSRMILSITNNKIELLILGKVIYFTATFFAKIFNLVNWKEKTKLK